MGMGFALTWVHQVTPRPPASYDHFNNWLLCTQFMTFYSLYSMHIILLHFALAVVRFLLLIFPLYFVLFYMFHMRVGLIILL